MRVLGCDKQLGKDGDRAMSEFRRLMGLILGLALVPGLVGFAPSPTSATAATKSKTSVAPTGLASISEVSHTGRWVNGEGGLLDRQTGTTTPALGTGGFVRDNPNLFLQNESSWEDGVNGYVVRREPIWLLNAETGARTRVDSDSAGNPLVPAWTGRGVSEDPSSKDSPQVIVSTESVTRDGSMVAFCANYDVPNQFTLYVKDIVSGALTKRTEGCGAGGPDPGGEYVRVDAPEVSFDGRVIHLRGAVYADGQEDLASFYRDTLVFPRSSKATRSLNGNGSMTRDGKTVFMRIGVHAHATADRTRGKVGIYNVATKKVKKLSGRYTIYGNDPLWFSAFDKATWRGRFVVYGNKTSVIDRKTGRVYDYGKVMRRHGYPPNRVTTSNSWSSGPMISGDGKVIFARSGGKYVALDWR
jgi:hypothetical protein